MSKIVNSIEYFNDPSTGRPISSGYIYIGNPDTDPTIEANQKTVYALQENGSQVAISQPISLSVGGNPIYNGSAVSLYVDGDYSLTAKNTLGSQMFYLPSNIEDISGTTFIFDTVADMVASTLNIGNIYSTKGYYASGDGGSADYLIKTPAEYGGTPDEYVDHTLASGDIAVLQYSNIINAKTAGATGDGSTDDYDAINAVIQFCNTNSLKVYFPSGTYLMSDAVTITRPASDVIGFHMFGDGRGLTTFAYTGTNTFDYFFEVIATTDYSINNEFYSFGIEVDDAPADTGGISLHAGVWRSLLTDLYIRRNNPSPRSGNGIYIGSSTASDLGSYDNKLSEMYLSGFNNNVYLQGTDLAGNTVTNVNIINSYISNANYNIYAEYTNGLAISGTQLESAIVAGLHAIYGETIVIMGGSIESAVGGAAGITMDANTKSIIAFCDFINNSGGDFNTNGNIGHMYKTANSGFVLVSGSEFRIDYDGTYASYLRFFKNGETDVRIKPSAANVVTLHNSVGTEYFDFDLSNKIFDLKEASSRVRLRNASYIEYLDTGSGVSTIDIMGSGTPEGAVTANPGSTYRNRDGGAGTSFYVKESGTGNTGWVGK